MLLLDKYEPSSREYTYLLLHKSSLLLFLPLELTRRTVLRAARSLGFINIYHNIISMQLPRIVLKWQSIKRLFRAAAVTRFSYISSHLFVIFCLLLTQLPMLAQFGHVQPPTKIKRYDFSFVNSFNNQDSKIR